MQIFFIVEFPAASDRCKEPKSIRSLRPIHQAKRAAAVPGVFIPGFHIEGVTT